MTLPEFTIFSRKQGCGYIFNNTTDIDKHLQKVPVTIAGTTLQPGEFTDMLGYFCRELEYMGMMNGNEMIFHIFSVADMFDQKHYYQCIFKIAEDRIFEMFAPGSGRDHYYIKGKWK